MKNRRYDIIRRARIPLRIVNASPTPRKATRQRYSFEPACLIVHLLSRDLHNQIRITEHSRCYQPRGGSPGHRDNFFDRSLRRHRHSSILVIAHQPGYIDESLLHTRPSHLATSHHPMNPPMAPQKSMPCPTPSLPRPTRRTTSSRPCTCPKTLMRCSNKPTPLCASSTTPRSSYNGSLR